MARQKEYDNNLLRNRLNGFRSRILNKCRNEGCHISTEWMDMHNFYDWAIANGYQLGFRLIRLDENGDFTPTNCVFVDKVKGHRYYSKKITYGGETKSIRVFAREYEIPKDTLNWRLKNGWSIGKALSTPTRKYKNYKATKEDELWE